MGAVYFDLSKELISSYPTFQAMCHLNIFLFGNLVFNLKIGPGIFMLNAPSGWAYFQMEV